MTVLVNKLEKEGYVRKISDPEDSRGVLVALTSKGQALEPIFEDISNGLEEKIAAKLNPREMQVLDDLLKKCVE